MLKNKNYALCVVLILLVSFKSFAQSDTRICYVGTDNELYQTLDEAKIATRALCDQTMPSSYHDPWG